MHLLSASWTWTSSGWLGQSGLSKKNLRKRVDVLGDPLYITYMTPSEFFTLDNPQGRFILSGTAANIFSEMARAKVPETELVFGELVDVRMDLSAWLHQGR